MPARLFPAVPLSRTLLFATALLGAGCALAGCTGPWQDSTHSAAVQIAVSAPADRPTTAARAVPAALPRELPGLGPVTLGAVPAASRQAVVVTGTGKDSSDSTAVLYQRTDQGWQAGAAWPAHNARNGWTDNHRESDLRSPIGVFTLSDAGGKLADPGSKLPYDRSGTFSISGNGFLGEPLAGSFDYVIAIDYNRVQGTSPLDPRRPQGGAKGGGIWLHVDHGGPTHACVSLAEPHMKELLTALDPAQHPVIVMGDAASLAR